MTAQQLDSDAIATDAVRLMATRQRTQSWSSRTPNAGLRW
jgi:hypothetical protein